MTFLLSLFVWTSLGQISSLGQVSSTNASTELSSTLRSIAFKYTENARSAIAHSPEEYTELEERFRETFDQNPALATTLIISDLKTGWTLTESEAEQMQISIFGLRHMIDVLDCDGLPIHRKFLTHEFFDSLEVNSREKNERILITLRTLFRNAIDLQPCGEEIFDRLLELDRSHRLISVWSHLFTRSPEKIFPILHDVLTSILRNNSVDFLDIHGAAVHLRQIYPQLSAQNQTKLLDTIANILSQRTPCLSPTTQIVLLSILINQPTRAKPIITKWLKSNDSDLVVAAWQAFLRIEKPTLNEYKKFLMHMEDLKSENMIARGFDLLRSLNSSAVNSFVNSDFARSLGPKEQDPTITYDTLQLELTLPLLTSAERVDFFLFALKRKSIVRWAALQNQQLLSADEAARLVKLFP